MSIDAAGALDVRSVPPGDIDEFTRTYEPTFGVSTDGPFGDYLRQITEVDRLYACYDGTVMVATGEIWTLELTVPGGVVPCAGFTSGRVLPTHRRTGLLSKLLRHQMEQALERGEPVAGGWVSDSAIHRRSGFAPATWCAEVRLERAHAELIEPVDVRGAVDLVDEREAVENFPAIHDTARRVTPGMANRSESRWRAWANYDLMHGGSGAGPRQFARWADRGYVSYRKLRRRLDRNPDDTILVGELVATDTEAYRGLWAWCLGLDLATSVQAPFRPVDEPLRHMLVAPRRLVASVADGLWLRVLDVPALLSARRYAIDGAIRIEVVDDWGFATGTYQLVVENGDGTCRRVSGIPDLAIPVAALGAAYLGGTSVTTLAAARRVDEHSAGAVARLSRMLAVDRAPWSAWSF